jgi:hypothetical protein
MDHTSVAPTTWFRAAFLLATDKRGVSASTRTRSSTSGTTRRRGYTSTSSAVFRFNRRQNPEAALQTLLGLGSQHPPVRRATIVVASDLPCYHEGDEIADADTPLLRGDLTLVDPV